MLEPADDVMEGGGAQEVLLLQPQLLALEEVVVRVQHPGDVLGQVAVKNGLDIIAIINYNNLKNININ